MKKNLAELQQQNDKCEAYNAPNVGRRNRAVQHAQTDKEEKKKKKIKNKKMILKKDR